MRKRFYVMAVLYVMAFSMLHAEDEQIRFQGKYIYSDGSEQFRTPARPEKGDSVTVRIRVRTGMAEQVLVHYGEGDEISMASLEKDGFYETFAARLPAVDENLRYYFSLAQGDVRVYYGRRGMEKRRPPRSVQFLIQPGYDIPSWMEGAVLYQIFPDRFFNGDRSNDVRDGEYQYDGYPAVTRTWDEWPDSERTYAGGSDRTREFYGGDIRGIMDKLDFLAELGIEGIYLNPVFVSPSNHKYDTQDYFHVDPHLGVIAEEGDYRTRTTAEVNLNASDGLFREFIEEAHARHIKVILDGVFNHSGSFCRWFDREHLYETEGAYESPDSAWRSFYQFNEEAWPDNESYNGWYGYKTLPKMNLERSPELEKAILDAAARWVGPEFGADGWRLDVAAEVGNTPGYNHEFWKKFRKAVKEANPDAVILAEVYGDSSSWLKGDEWDTIMNYDAFFDPVSHFLTGMEKHSWYELPELYNNTDSFSGTLLDRMARIPWPSLATAMNQLSNHDHSRFYSRTGRYADSTKQNGDISYPERADDNLNKGIMKEAVLLQMFMPGAPALYYGEEAGLPGFTDPDCRRPYPWGQEDGELLSYYKAVIALREEFSCLRGGSFLSLPTGRQGTYAFIRWNGTDSALVVINNREEDVRLNLSLEQTEWGRGDRLTRKLLTAQDGYDLTEESIRLRERGVILDIPSRGGMVFREEKKRELPEMGNPEIIRFSLPRNGVAGSVTVHFDRPMNQRQILDAFSLSPERKGRFFWNGNSVTFVPSTNVFPGDYEVAVTQDISSLSGNFALNETVHWKFSVK